MKRLGFTLIELLVVIGILSLLMALTSSVLHAVREQAKATKCQANIRQLGLELINYSIENDRFPMGLTPPSGPSVPTIGSLRHDPPGQWWFQSMGLKPKRYDTVQIPLQCPSKQIDSVVLQSNILWGNYGVNWSVCAGTEHVLPVELQENITQSLSPAKTKNPSAVYLLGDSGYSMIGWQHAASPVKALSTSQGPLATSYIPGLSVNRDRELHLVQQADAIEGRHPNRTVNMGFVDGHVERRKADDLLVELIADGLYTNRTPLWKPR